MSQEDIHTDVCVIGMGPAGIGVGAGLVDARFNRSAVWIDAGSSLQERECQVIEGGSCVFHEPCRIISGMGGSSLLTGGKLSMLPAGRGLSEVVGSFQLTDSKMHKALELLRSYTEILSQMHGDSEIQEGKELYEKLGFEMRYYDSYLVDPRGLWRAYEDILAQMQQSGFRLMLETVAQSVEKTTDGFMVCAQNGERRFSIHARSAVIVASGRLGVSLLTTITDSLLLPAKHGSLDVGMRLEYPTEILPGIDRYHNDLKLLFGDSRTFCVCKNGRVVSYALDGQRFTEGSRGRCGPTGYTNVAVMMRVEPPESVVLWSEMVPPIGLHGPLGPTVESLYDLDHLVLTDRTMRVTTTLADFDRGSVIDRFPGDLGLRIRQRVLQFATGFLPRSTWDEVAVLAPELGVLYPQFHLDSYFSVLPGLYIVGDATGRFRGILQALCSGIICGEGLADSL